MQELIASRHRRRASDAQTVIKYDHLPCQEFNIDTALTVSMSEKEINIEH